MFRATFSDTEMFKRIRVLTVAGLVAVAFGISGIVACDTPGDAEAEENEEAEEYHSPFYIDGQGELHFETVSFTDVGLKAREDGPADQLVLEAIAESLAQQLEVRESFEYDTDVGYDESLEDPANHMYCDREHLYVALWRGYDPDRWGYSLWSGCHEQQQFEWAELEDPHSRDDVDTITWVEPLTEEIVDSVEEAHEEECFSRAC